MITFTDREYRSTKRIKQGKQRLHPPFDELAAWIASKWNVTVLNVIYDDSRLVQRPRLQVILERPRDLKPFKTGINFDRGKQKRVAREFAALAQRINHGTYNLDRLLVVFSCFSRLAKEEADSKITEAEVTALQQRIANPDLWLISRCFGHVTFFFYTDEHARKYERLGLEKLYAGTEGHLAGVGRDGDSETSRTTAPQTAQRRMWSSTSLRRSAGIGSRAT